MCPAHINIHCNEADVYQFTTIDLHHSHAAFFNDELPAYKPASKEQKQVVKEYAVINCISCCDLQILLNSHFPHHPLCLSQISNLMNQAKQEAWNHVKILGGNIIALTSYLMVLKEKDNCWVIYLKIDPKTCQLISLFWMLPQQVTLSMHFGDVIINNITLMHNKYNMPLNIWVVIDHQFKTQNITYILQTSETIKNHQWVVLGHLFSILPPHPSHVYFSNFDLALNNILSRMDVWHELCQHHLSGNIMKNLAPVLGGLYQTFIDTFWQVYYSISTAAFDAKWEKLLVDFP